MPYIKPECRDYFDKEIEDIVENIAQPGDLCYVIYKLLNDLTNKNKCFKTMSSLIAEVESAKLEFYRRIAAPYEDQKIIENGDVK
jgi:hypothetical protein